MKKLFISLLATFALFGCEDSTEVKQVNVQPIVVQEPSVTVVNVSNNVSYSLLDVENNYVSCLIREGIDQDDYCEEMCSFVFDYESCDTIEDKYELLYGIGSDKPKRFESPYKKKSIVRTSNWETYKRPECTVTPLASTIEAGKEFKQTQSCKQSYIQTVYYEDGSKNNSFKIEKSSKETYQRGTKVVDVKPAANSTYSSNLATKPVTQTTVTQPAKDVAKPVVDTVVKGKTDSAKLANQYSSNLIQKTDSKPVNVKSVEEAKTAIVKPKSSDLINANKYSSNLVANAKVTDDKKASDKSVSKAKVYTSNLVQPKKPVTIVDSGSWRDVGMPTCGSWSPSEYSKPKNKSFTQKQSCKQKQVKIIKYSDGKTKKETKTKSFSKTRTAYGKK